MAAIAALETAIVASLAFNQAAGLQADLLIATTALATLSAAAITAGSGYHAWQALKPR